jgi:transposase
MAYNFFELNRDQQFLLPQDMRDWLPEGDLALFVIEAVEQMDLSDFYAPYRSDGWGAVAYEPSMMVALMIYSSCLGERSSRKIESLCGRDAGFRVITGNHVPDHSTIARFRKDHEQSISGLFGQVLALCARAGIVKPAVIAIDGTKIKASASLDANRSHSSLAREYEELARRMLEEANRVDAEEDRIYGPGNRGDEVPEELRDEKTRRAWIKERLDEMNRQAGSAAEEQQEKIEKREERRKAGEKHLGRNPLSPSVVRERFLKDRARVNTTDPESRMMKSARGFVQGFNAQAAVTEDQIIVAAHLTQDEADWHQLHPMAELAAKNLKGAGVETPMGSVVADAGYGSEDNLAEAERLTEQSLEAEDVFCPNFLVATKKSRILALEMAEQAAADEKDGNSLAASPREEDPARPPVEEQKAREDLTAAERMNEKLKAAEGREIYAKRGKTVEPVFGQLKDGRKFERFMRRGLDACQAEWSLMCSTHNLLKLWRFETAPAKNG